MKAKVLDTGEIVNVTPNPTWYKENGQGPDRREWDEDELEFIPNPNAPKMVSLNKVCEYIDEYTPIDYDCDGFIEDLKKQWRIKL